MLFIATGNGQIWSCSRRCTVVYNVNYRDVSVVGRVVRRRERSYAYQAEVDSVRADWERAVDAHANYFPVTYNRSLVKGKVQNKLDESRELDISYVGFVFLLVKMATY